MNLNLNAEQFVELYSVLNEKQTPALQDLKSKMKLSLIETLSTVEDTNNHSRFPQWFKKEKEKVEAMENQLKMINATTDDGLFTPPPSFEKR